MLVFVIVDLFVNVPEFDGIRPTSRTYRAVRYAAHRMVGERYDETDEFGARDRVARTVRSEWPQDSGLEAIAAELETALASGDWRQAWRVTRGSPAREVRMPGLGKLLGEAFVENQRRRPRAKERLPDWVADNEAIKNLVLATRPEAEFADAMRRVAEALASNDRVESIQESENLLLRGLIHAKVLSPDAAFEAIGHQLEPVIESGSRDFRSQRAGHVLASLSTPQATRVILRAIENKTFLFPGVLRVIHDPGSAGPLGESLRRARDFHLADELVAALLQCGDPGINELRIIVRSANGVPGHVLGPAMRGLAGAAHGSRDLSLLETRLERSPNLGTAINHALGASDYDDRRAEAFLDYIKAGGQVLLHGIVQASARWSGPDADEYRRRVGVQEPRVHEEIRAARGRLEEQARVMSAAAKRRR